MLFRSILSFSACDGNNLHTTSAIDLFASNDNKNFKRVASLTKGFPENQNYAKYNSPIISLGAPYRYIRIVPVDVENEVNPMAFSLSELQIFNGTPNIEKSFYYKYEDLKIEVDNLYNLMNDSQQEIDNHTAIDLTNKELLQQQMDVVKILLKEIEDVVNSNTDKIMTDKKNNIIYNNYRFCFKFANDISFSLGENKKLSNNNRANSFMYFAYFLHCFRKWSKALFCVYSSSYFCDYSFCYEIVSRKFYYKNFNKRLFK